MEGVRHYETDCFAQPLPEGGAVLARCIEPIASRQRVGNATRAQPIFNCVALRQVSYTQIGPNALWLDVSASPDKIPG
jgi:hypothetical protein